MIYVMIGLGIVWGLLGLIGFAMLAARHFQVKESRIYLGDNLLGASFRIGWSILIGPLTILAADQLIKEENRILSSNSWS